MISVPLGVLDAGGLAAWCGLVRCAEDIDLRAAAAPRTVIGDILALIADRHEGNPAAVPIDVLDLQRAPVTWFDDLPLATDGLQWSDRLDCSIASGLAVTLALREGLPLLSFDPRLAAAPGLRVVRLPR